LQTGNNYTRLTADSFWESWSQVTYQPTYQEWVSLLAQEAAAMANGQGHNPLTVLLGDSISLWFPVEQLENNRFWLNQGISGDTTGGILRRLHLLDDTHPAEIHLMAGINDLRRGSSDAEVLTNLRQIMQELRSRHPQSQILVYSILPTRYANLPSDRIQSLNQQIAAIAQMEGVQYLDLTQYFADAEGKLRADLTTDGLHLNFHGYAMWDWIMGWQMVESR
jgi:lysophospholipase L1-like esterase